MFARIPWAKVWEEAIDEGGTTDDLRGFFPLVELNLFATYRVVVSNYVGGLVLVKLRFGFTQADAAASPNGCDLPPVSTALGSGMASVVFDVAATPPGVVGSPPGILPPIAAVLITTDIGTDLTYAVYAAMIGL